MMPATDTLSRPAAVDGGRTGLCLRPATGVRWSSITRAGLRVALLDYFVNVSRELKNPKMIELAIYERTERSAVTDGSSSAPT